MSVYPDAHQLYTHHLGMAPIRIELELTEVCNLKCRFCYNSGAPIRVSTCDALNILDRLSQQGVMEIILTGGEPLMHPGFDVIATHTGKTFTHALLQTNGTLLTREKLTLLVNSGFVGLNVSLHGNEETHEDLAGVTGSYRDAMSAIDLVLESPLALWVNTVLTNRNWKGVGKQLLAMKRQGVRHFTFTRFTPTGSGKDAELAMNLGDLADLVRTLDDFRCDNPECSVLVANAIPRCSLPLEYAHYSEPCSYGVDRFYVDVKGELMICGMARIPLGNVLTQTLEEIKRDSPSFKSMSLNEALPTTCKQCKEVMRCRGGCRAAALATSGTLNGIDPLVAL